MVNKLVARRGQIKGNLTRFWNYVSTPDNDPRQIGIRRSKLEEAWEEFQQIQSEIGAEEDANEHENYQLEFEELYFKAIAKAEERLQRLQKIEDPSGEVKSGKNSAKETSSATPVVKLAALNVPIFSGLYAEWAPFYDMYTALIHNNDNLTTIQKFFYLRSSLSDDAANCIKNLETTTNNYEHAWNSLVTRYNNKRLLVQTHVKGICDLPIVKVSSSSSLRQFSDDLRGHISALRALKQRPSEWGPLLTHIICTKLDAVTISEWETKCPRDEIKEVDELIDFLEGRFHILEAIESSKRISDVTKNVIESSHASRKNRYTKYSTSSASFINTSELKCYVCQLPHTIYKCPKFIALSAIDRIKKVKDLNLCSVCLRRHGEKKCFARHCLKCGKPHNTLLHINNFSQRQGSVTETSEGNSKTAEEIATAISVTAHAFTACETVLLATVVALAVSPYAKTAKCRALLDSGSQKNFITEEMVQALRLKKDKIRHVISGIGETVQHASSSVWLKIKSRISNYSVYLPMVVVPKITGQLPTQNIRAICDVPEYVKLADPYFNTPHKVDILLGATHFYEFLCDGQIRPSPAGPLFRETVFGWVAVGAIVENSLSKISTSNTFFSTVDGEHTIENVLQRFWRVEELGDTAPYTSEERICQEYFKNTVTRNGEGRFVVHLPFRDDVIKLGESYEIAKRRFLAIERKLQKDTKLQEEYFHFMKEYEALKHMERVEENDCGKTNQTCYLPHHAVRKDSSTSTKLRVVFDASCKTDTGISLNDVLLKGPVIQDDLLYIIARFRTHNYVLTADIVKMYRQILMTDKHRDYQRILWRTDPNLPIQTYRLNTITYGTVPASYLATGCLQVLAETAREKYPYITHIINNDFYMDDLLTGADTEYGVIRIRDGLIAVMNSAGLMLRKWSSNNANLVALGLPSEHIELSNKYEPNYSLKKILGLYWDASSDKLKYNVRESKNVSGMSVTKREILSDISAIFDPLGLVGPLIVRAKILLQSLWREKIDWDEPVQADIREKWVEYRTQLSALNGLSISRKITNNLKSGVIEVHGFSDASTVAYGCCLYLRCTDDVGVHHTNLICAKSKVAPLKTLSLPRLELCAALLLTRLANNLIPKLQLKVSRQYFWTDSKIVLAWIASSSTKWKTFVAHRVSEIQDKTAINEWRHVNTHENPADVISRGCCPSKLTKLTLWWSGPDWLTKDESNWPENPDAHHKLENVPEGKEISVSVMCVADRKDSILNKYESLTKCLRVTAYCLRFRNNARKNGIKLKGFLVPEELERATLILVKVTQNIGFVNELRELSSGKVVSSSSKLFRLRPFIDGDGVIRVGGRLKNAATIDVFQRHPIVLPAHCSFSKMLFHEEHIRLMHGGPQVLLSSIRLKYWPLNGRNLARHTVHKCVRCFRNKPIFVQPIMGDLPGDRVKPGRAFMKCGIDFAGPFFTKSSALRKAPITKTYACIFVCLATKAVHIEAVSDLTTQAFVNALNRFFDRRGKSTVIYSDNATNFIGANRKLKEVYQLFQTRQLQEDVMKNLTNIGVKWQFIPPRSPHFGGLWEAAVKSMKMLLGRVLGEAHLTYEELCTVLTRAEACLNSRPLTTLSIDPSDPIPLTPGHFLIGDSLTAVPEEDVTTVATNRLTRWRRVTQYSQQLWHRWSGEYLCQLQQRSKWAKEKGPKLNVGTVVMVKEDNLPPLQWRLGLVNHVYRGSDGVIRSAEVTTAGHRVKRAVRTLCPLPFGDNIG